MANRQTRGRQRIPISLIQNRDDLYATFSKRRMGLYKKASELSTLCGVDIGVLIFSPTNVPYSFFHPTMESVINKYINPNQPQDTYTRTVESSTRSRIDALNRELDHVLEQKHAVKERGKYLDEIEHSRGEKGWWEAPIESLDSEQVKEWIELFQGFKGQVESKIEQLQNGGSTSIVPSSAIPMDQYYNYSGIINPDEFAAQDPVDASFYNYVSQQDPFAASGSGHIPNPVFSSTTSSYQVTNIDGNGISHYMYPQDPLSGQFFNSSTSLVNPDQFFLNSQTMNSFTAAPMFQFTAGGSRAATSHQGQGLGGN